MTREGNYIPMIGGSMRSRRLVMLAAMLLVASCSDPSEPPKIGIEISPREAEIGVGDTLRLTAAVSDHADASSEIRWISRRPVIATVDTTGLIMGINPGVVTIIAIVTDSPSIADSVGVIVSVPVAAGHAAPRGTVAVHKP